MNSNTALLLLFISVLGRSDAFTSLVPAGKELIYNYHARLRLGTFKPAEFASQFILDGKLHMQNDEKSILMRFSDLKFKLYNGEINGVNEKESLPLDLPQEAKDILKPFMVIYNGDGKAKNLITDEYDPIFSRNIKKALASIMQLDMKEINFDSKLPHAFTTTETSIYGKDLVRYNVIPAENDFVIQKMLNVLNSTPSIIGITDEDLFFSKNKLPLAMDSQRKYTLSKNDHGWYIKRIETHGGIFMNIMKGLSISQQMSTIQRMQLLEIISIKDKIYMGIRQVEEELTFKRDSNNEAECLPDLSFGRNGIKMEQYKDIILNILDELVIYLDEDQLAMKTPNIRHGQAVNRLHNLMGQLTLSTLEQLFVSLADRTAAHEKKKFIAFQQMIPLIGTRASTILVRNLIREKKVNDEIAISMLRKMPSFLRMPSSSLLTQVEDLMDLKNTSDSVQQAALLSFASLISKIHRNNDNEANLKLQENYVLKIISLLEATKDYTLQHMYMKVLFNIRYVSKFLEPYVKGEATTNHHLRYLAMCASLYEMREDPERAFSIYWPILTDRSQHLELRSFAYLTIMSTRPSLGKLADIYWLLRNEPNPDLYHLFYTHLIGIAQTTDPTIPIEIRAQAAQMLNSIHKPFRHPLTGFYSMDYIDPKYGFAAISNSMFIASKTSRIMYVDFSNELYSLPNTYYSIWIKIDAGNITLLDTLPNVNNRIQLLFKVLTTLKNDKDIHIEYALVDRDKVVESKFFNYKNINELMDKFENLVKDTETNLLDISYDMITEILIPNDLGFSTMFQYKIPRIKSYKISITSGEAVDEFKKHANIKFQTSQHSALEMVTYNPIAGFWQGIHRLQLYDMAIPLNVSLVISKKFNDFNITINKNNDKKTGAMGIRTLARTSVSASLGDRHNLLKKSSESSEPFAEVTRGSKYKKTKMLFEHDCIHTGMKYQIAAFDTELPISRRTVMSLLNLVSQKSFKNAKTTSQQLLITIRNLFVHIVLAPAPETFGLVIRGIPSTEHPVDKIEVLLQMLQNSYQPNENLNAHVSLATLTNENKIINQWDFNALYEENSDKTLKNYHLQYTRVHPERENFRMCIDGKKEWTNNEINGRMKITMGYTTNPKSCVDTEGIVEINMTGQQSDEQRKLMDDHLTYRECAPSNVYEPMMEDIRIPQHESVECIEKQTSIRHFEYDIKINSVQHEKILGMYGWIDYLKALLLPHYSEEKVNKKTDNNLNKLIVDYPIAGNEVNISMIQNEKIIKFIEAPTKYLAWFGFYPDSYHFSSKFLRLQQLGLTESCLVNKEQLLNTMNEVSAIHDEDWTLIAYNNPEILANQSFALYVKGTDNLALRVIMDDQNLEIASSGKIILNEKFLIFEKDSYHYEPLFAIQRLHDKHHSIILHLFSPGLYIAFDGRQMIVEKSTLFKSLSGICFMY